MLNLQPRQWEALTDDSVYLPVIHWNDVFSKLSSRAVVSIDV